MKVVLFCGGKGLRLREYSHALPKPMVPVGGLPVLVHVMQYYAHFGHKDFVLCLGYKGDVIEQYFYERGARATPLRHDEDAEGTPFARVAYGDWTITFARTGIDVNIGGRLRAVRSLVEGEEIFLANYSDDLTDASLDELVDAFTRNDRAVASFLSVRPNLSLHAVATDPEGRVVGLESLRDTGVRVNGGYFIFRRAIFDVLHPGEELVEEPFHRLIERGALVAHQHHGFWGPLDTLKDHQYLEELEAAGTAPWRLADGPARAPAVEAGVMAPNPSD